MTEAQVNTNRTTAVLTAVLAMGVVFDIIYATSGSSLTSILVGYLIVLGAGVIMGDRLNLVENTINRIKR